jgi:L-lactate dehydrogenase complex protein LldF
MLVHLRSRVVADARRSSRLPSAEATLMSAARWTMLDPRRWARALRSLRTGRLLGRRRDRIATLPPPLSTWTGTRDLPRPPAETFRDWWTRTGEHEDSRP